MIAPYFYRWELEQRDLRFIWKYKSSFHLYPEDISYWRSPTILYKLYIYEPILIKQNINCNEH